MQTIDQLCVQRDSRITEREEICFSCAPWQTWTLNLAGVRNVQAMGKLRVEESRTILRKRQVMGETVFRKPGFVFVPPSVVEQNVKQKPEMDLAELPGTSDPI